MPGLRGAGAGAAAGAGAGAGRCACDGAGAACWRVTLDDWRPIERPPPSGLAVASAIIDMAVSAIIMLAKNFFIVVIL
jgi:hypothetical protein